MPAGKVLPLFVSHLLVSDILRVTSFTLNLHPASVLSADPQVMYKQDSYYPAPRDDGLHGWLRPRREANGLGSCSLSAEAGPPSQVIDIDEDILGVLQCIWTTSSPSAAGSDPFASRTGSIVSAPESLPEIPFVVTTIEEEDDEEDDIGEEDVDDSESFWLRRRPAEPATPSERQLAILGHAPERILGHCRQRSGSLSSTGSRPAPAKSILSSSSSTKTRKGRSTPSVKFLDMPTIHFEDEGEDDDEGLSFRPGPFDEPRRANPNLPLKGKKRIFGFLDWFSSPNKNAKAAVHSRPVISGPLPLWEGRRCSSETERTAYGRCPSPTGARSIRSIRSTNSLRSVRSCASRLQGYWTRLSGKDP